MLELIETNLPIVVEKLKVMLSEMPALPITPIIIGLVAFKITKKLIHAVVSAIVFLFVVLIVLYFVGK